MICHLLIIHVHFVFLLIKFHCVLSCKMIPYYVYLYCIVFWLGSDRLPGLLSFRARFTSLHTHASLLTFRLYLSYFVLAVPVPECLGKYSCMSARMFGKTLVHEFPISYSHTEWYFLFSFFGARETKHAQRTLL